jgi:hypothetical protein
MWILETAGVEMGVRFETQVMRHYRDLEMLTELYFKAVASHRPRKAANRLVLCGKKYEMFLMFRPSRRFASPVKSIIAEFVVLLNPRLCLTNCRKYS